MEPLVNWPFQRHFSGSAHLTANNREKHERVTVVYNKQFSGILCLS